MSQVAVIGLGRFGFHAARHLHAQGHEVLAIDIDPELVQRIRDDCTRAVVLDARDKERLEELGVADFDVVVISLGERVDTSSLVAMHMRELGVRRVITKAGSEDHAKLLDLIGVDEILFPEEEVARRMAERLTHRNILDSLALGESHSIHEVAPPDAFCGKSLAELRLRNRYGIQVLAMRDTLTDDLAINPGPEAVIKESDELVVLGRNEDLNRLRRL